MTKRIYETQAGRALSAYAVLKGADLVAKVLVHHGQSRVTVEVVAGGRVQTGKASGYGYDKFTAALAGLVIDGHTMSDHCGIIWHGEGKAPKGYYPGRTLESGYVQPAYQMPGLRYLVEIGYTVIQVL